MTLTVKDPPELTSLGKHGTPGQNSGAKSGESPRSNPVCLETPVTVRSLPEQNGNLSDASGPRREEGRTVIVFDNGAVLRLPTNLPAGQKVILSNAQGRDVVCRVVNGRSLQTLKGYIEIEFVEPVDDFWRIHQAADPGAGSSLPSPLLPSPQPLPGVTHSASPVAPRVAAPGAETITRPGSAPSFEDIAGLVRMSPTAAERLKTKAMVPQRDILDGGSGPKHGQTDSSKHASEASAPAPIAAAHGEMPAAPAARQSPSLPIQKTDTSNDFMSKGMLASGQLSSDPSTSESRGSMKLIIGGAALVLAGFGAGFLFMHHGSTAPPAAPAAVAAAPSIPSSPSQSAVADQVQVLTPAVEQAPTQSQPVSTSAPITAESRVPTLSEPQSSRPPASSTIAKQPDSAETRRPEIPNLKMSKPTAASQNLAKLSAGAAPAVTDVASAVALGGVPSGSVLSPIGRTENQPAPPPSLGSSAPPKRVVRDPKLISSTRPVYPPLARQSGIQGSVIVSAEVAANGSVGAVTAISGPMFLRQSAIESVKQWKYAPALIDGKPVDSHVTVSIEFRLN